MYTALFYHSPNRVTEITLHESFDVAVAFLADLLDVYEIPDPDTGETLYDRCERAATDAGVEFFIAIDVRPPSFIDDDGDW